MPLQLISFFDFHLHSPISNQKSNEKIEWSTDERVATYLAEVEDLVAVAFSDHNSFDVNFYQKMQKLIQWKTNGKTKLFPAIEIDVRREAAGYKDLNKNALNKGNVILVFDNLMEKEQLEQLELICKRFLHPASPIHFSKLNELFQKFSYFAIAHANKEQSFNYEDIIKINHLIAYEVGNLKTRGDIKRIDQKLHHNYAIVTGSDCHHWNDRKRYSVANLRNYLPFFTNENWNFNDLQMAIKEQNNCLLDGNRWLIQQDINYATIKIKQILMKWRT